MFVLLLCTLALAAKVASSSTSNSSRPYQQQQMCCSPHGDAYLTTPLTGRPDSCPVSLGARGGRRHRWLPRGGETKEAFLSGMAAAAGEPASWAPWTHVPVCGNTTNFCVFTLASLPWPPGGMTATARAANSNSTAKEEQRQEQQQQEKLYHGFSVITTPEMAAYAVNPREFALNPAQFDLYPGVSSPVGAPFDFGPDGAKPAFEIRQVGGNGSDSKKTGSRKGFGVVAIRAISAGEPVIIDRPALLAHWKYQGLDNVPHGSHAPAVIAQDNQHGLERETAAHRRRMWRAAVDQLPPQLEFRIRSLPVLPRYKKSVAAGQMARDEAILASNAIIMDIQGYPFMALFPSIAKINHDCKPNLVGHIFESPMLMVAMATRDIAAGEELTLSYFPGILPHDERTGLLRRRWGFECQCDACRASSSEAERNASDERLRHLRSLPKRMQQAVADGKQNEALELALEGRDIYIREGRMRDGLLRCFGDALGGDPFGPPGFAETLLHVYLSVQDYDSALLQARAAFTEELWKSGGWPTAEQMKIIGKLERILMALEAKVGGIKKGNSGKKKKAGKVKRMKQGSKGKTVGKEATTQ